MNESPRPSNIPNPDPSLATNERLEDAKQQLRREMAVIREESKSWIEDLQLFLERKVESGDALLSEKVTGGLRNIGTRLDGNDTALVAALKAQKEEAAKQTENFKEVLGEIKAGIAKQFDSLVNQLNEVKLRMSESGGRSVGMSSTVGMVISAIAALAAIISVAVVLSRPSSVEVHPSNRSPVSYHGPHIAGT
jgi:hypothetical protein